MRSYTPSERNWCCAVACLDEYLQVEEVAPERNLLANIIYRALVDYMSASVSPQDRRDAETWIFLEEDDGDRPFSLLWILNHLEIANPQEALQGIRAYCQSFTGLWPERGQRLTRRTRRPMRDLLEECGLSRPPKMRVETGPCKPTSRRGAKTKPDRKHPWAWSAWNKKAVA